VWRSTWFIARKDVAHALRQKETLLWTFLMPILFFYFIGTVTGGFGGGGSEDSPDPLALRAPAAGGFLVDELVLRLEAEHFAVARPASDEELERYDRRLILPDPTPEQQQAGLSFSDSALAGERTVLTFRRRGEGLGAQHDRVRVARAVYGVLADLVVTSQGEGGPGPESFRALAAMPRALSLRVESAGKREEIPSGFEQTIPGTLTMFTMLVLLTSGAILLVTEREQGLLRRLASTPIPRAALVLGKWSGKMALGLIQIAFAMAAGTVLFGMDWGATLWMVCLLLFAWAAFNASLGILLGNLARSEAQMAGMGVVGTMVLAALGGCWWPIEVTPQWMQSLALVLPTGWTMDALHQLVNFGYGPAAALPHLSGLLVAAFVLGWLGVRTFRYE